jgi:hypothetical protein
MATSSYDNEESFKELLQKCKRLRKKTVQAQMECAEALRPLFSEEEHPSWHQKLQNSFWTGTDTAFLMRLNHHLGDTKDPAYKAFFKTYRLAIRRERRYYLCKQQAEEVMRTEFQPDHRDTDLSAAMTDYLEGNGVSLFKIMRTISPPENE